MIARSDVRALDRLQQRGTSRPPCRICHLARRRTRARHVLERKQGHRPVTAAPSSSPIAHRRQPEPAANRHQRARSGHRVVDIAFAPRVAASASAFVASRSRGVRPADVCFHDCDNATRPDLTAALVYIPPRVARGRRRLLTAVAASLSKHYVARGSLVLRVARRHCCCLGAHSELHRLPRDRGDAPVSRARRDEWSSS
jgi:hypothetical protein